MSSHIYVLTRGGFGNIMFNYIIGESLSEKYKIPVVYVDDSNITVSRPPMSSYNLYKDCTIMKHLPHIVSPVIIKEPNHFYNEIQPLLKNKTYVLDGYFQSWKYFSMEVIEKLKQKLNVSSNDKNQVCLHIRRGDYLNHPTIHTCPSKNYYKGCLEDLAHKTTGFTVKVFSDDNNYAMSLDFLKDYNYEIITEQDTYKTFLLMMECTHFIISNSSFSLLAWYLRTNTDGWLYAPGVWFGIDGPKFKIEDIIHTEGKVIIR